MAERSIVKRLFSMLIMIGVALAVFGLALAGATWITIDARIGGRVVVVPELFGMSEDEATRALSDLGLSMVVNRDRVVHSNLVEKGRVVLQVPRQGSEIKAGREVQITVSAGPARKLIPDLRGETISFASTLLDDVDTSFAIVSRVPDATLTKGRVLSQWPEPDGELGLRSGVSVLVADGEPLPDYVMPDLIGRDYLAVKAFLDKEGLRHVVKYRREDEDLGQLILDQAPKAGFQINRARTITLTVNKDF